MWVLLGLLLGWLALWDTGLIHRRDLIGVVLQVLARKPAARQACRAVIL